MQQVKFKEGSPSALLYKTYREYNLVSIAGGTANIRYSCNDSWRSITVPIKDLKEVPDVRLPVDLPTYSLPYFLMQKLPCGGDRFNILEGDHATIRDLKLFKNYHLPCPMEAIALCHILNGEEKEEEEVRSNG